MAATEDACLLSWDFNGSTSSMCRTLVKASVVVHLLVAEADILISKCSKRTLLEEISCVLNGSCRPQSKDAVYIVLG